MDSMNMKHHYWQFGIESVETPQSLGIRKRTIKYIITNNMSLLLKVWMALFQ